MGTPRGSLRCTGPFAETGTPQKWVRLRAIRAFKPFSAESGTVSGLCDAEIGTHRRGAAAGSGFAVPVSAWIRGLRQACEGSTACDRCRFELPCAESGTPGARPAVEKPVESVSYPRRSGFAAVAETGSVCRRFRFGRSQKQVRLRAESGTARGKKSFQINGAIAPYTVYE